MGTSHKDSFKVFRLEQIASVRLGFTFRSKIEAANEEKANAHVVNIADTKRQAELSYSFDVSADHFPKIEWSGKPSAYISEGAILLASRGYFKASLLTKAEVSALPVIATSQFLVIEVTEGVIPAFLCWSLNRPSTQRYLKDGAARQGTNIQALKASEIKQLEVAVPPISTQEKILKINSLWEREQHLTQALLKNRQNMLNGMFSQLIEGK